jgi:flagellar basal body-associated protein FliL
VHCQPYDFLTDSSKSKKKSSIIVAIVVSVAATAIVIALTTLFIWRRKRNKARKPGSIQFLQTVGLHTVENLPYLL